MQSITRCKQIFISESHDYGKSWGGPSGCTEDMSLCLTQVPSKLPEAFCQLAFIFETHRTFSAPIQEFQDIDELLKQNKKSIHTISISDFIIKCFVQFQNKSLKSSNHFGAAEAKPNYFSFQLKQNVEGSLGIFLHRVGQDCYILLLSPQQQLPVQFIPPACSFAASLPTPQHLPSHSHCQSPWLNSPNHFCCQ